MSSFSTDSDFLSFALPKGTKLLDGKVEILDYKGHGGFGITYLGSMSYKIGTLAQVEHKTVIVKEYFLQGYSERDHFGRVVPSVNAKELFDRYLDFFNQESEYLHRINHPYIIDVYERFNENGTSYYVMEYDENLVPLTSMNPISAELALPIIVKVGRALMAMHHNKWLHLDIKPDNILVSKDFKKLKVIDFGLVMSFDHGSKVLSMVAGGYSAGFSAPELINCKFKDFTPAPDLYSLGCTLYALVKGVPPVLENGVFEWDDSKLPSHVMDFVSACLQSDPNKRPVSVEKALSIFPEYLLAHEDDILNEWETIPFNPRDTRDSEPGEKYKFHLLKDSFPALLGISMFPLFPPVLGLCGVGGGFGLFDSMPSLILIIVVLSLIGGILLFAFYKNRHIVLRRRIISFFTFCILAFFASGLFHRDLSYFDKYYYVYSYHGKLGIADLWGKHISSPIYDKIVCTLPNGMVVVGLNHCVGIIDSYGKIILPIKYKKLINHTDTDVYVLDYYGDTEKISFQSLLKDTV